ncbi:NAD-dependent epimerase/dehydratase family protein [Streptomyces sp. NPDC059743]|uniref:NAD-dependent epimerase/dehydratase family protein n=1 Tax=Streptomyces sp. NPDC059743 TaxID=3346928 RepID=UPI00364CDE4F
MRNLVIGATGTIGSAVVGALSNAPHEVIGVSRSSRIRADLEVSVFLGRAVRCGRGS